MSLPTIPHDKALHFVYGAVIAAVLLMVLRVWVPPVHAAFAALLLTTAIGALKEVYDHFWQNGTAEIEDAIATTGGAFMVVIGHLL